ncbi:hypothetical protein [Sphingobacterium cellulitidis]|uniref:hypothetical protein n=1 Tax=Sphingobacterium cellulitidis TaxID=1768011 RepID=UPI000B93AAD0|nr:hypothetical protein CHT99_02915 [Sphingobacterium cellulitidis]
MDENIEKVEASKLSDKVGLDDTSYLFRLAPSKLVDRQDSLSGKRRIPNESVFELREGEEGLSMNWDKYICEKKSLILRGLTYKKNSTDFIDPSSCLVFKLPTSMIKDYANIKYSPIFIGNPSPIGFPNNKSHCDVIPSNEGMALKLMMDLVDYCKNEHEKAFCDTNYKSLRPILEEYRAQGNNTPFHTDWEFAEE